MMPTKSTAVLTTVMVLGLLTSACGGGDEETARATTAPSITCKAFFRQSLTGAPQPGETVELPASGGDESVTVGDFNFRVLYNVDPLEGTAVDVFVDTVEGSKPIVQHKYQFDEDGPGALFVGGHGFSGLAYVRHPESGSELQYFCSEG